MSSADHLPSEDNALELRSVELQIALGLREMSPESFETDLYETVEDLGGVVLFLMRIEEDEQERAVAAVSLPSEEAGREVAIVTADPGFESVSVEPAHRSQQPVASVASSYAGLAESWQKAA